MKICVTSSGENLKSMVDPRFGRCQYFLIVDADSQKVEAIRNTGVRAARGAGITAAQIVSDSGCEVVITGNVGPNAFNVLSGAGIKIYTGASGRTCEQALKDFNDGKLGEAKAQPVGWGRCGFGRGAGRGAGYQSAPGQGGGGRDTGAGRGRGFGGRQS